MDLVVRIRDLADAIYETTRTRDAFGRRLSQAICDLAAEMGLGGEVAGKHRVLWSGPDGIEFVFEIDSAARWHVPFHLRMIPAAKRLWIYYGKNPDMVSEILRQEDQEGRIGMVRLPGYRLKSGARTPSSAP